MTEADFKAEQNRLWKQQLEEWTASGMSAKGWCRQQGMPYYKFRYWKRKILGSGESIKKQSSPVCKEDFIEIPQHLENHPPVSSGILIEGPGFSIRLEENANQTLVMELLKTLGAEKC